jgi:hypothetical protein
LGNIQRPGSGQNSEGALNTLAEVFYITGNGWAIRCCCCDAQFAEEFGRPVKEVWTRFVDHLSNPKSPFWTGSGEMDGPHARFVERSAYGVTR